MKYPRSLAVRVLTRVLSEQQPLDEALENAFAGLAPAQKAWLQEVCSGTLRWKGRLDFALDSVALKKKPSGWLRKILLIACYQIIVQTRTAAAAVVSETVSEVKMREGEAPARFANACLRKITEHATQWRELQPQTAADAALASLPLWLWEKLVAQHGFEWARGYAHASLERPTLWLRARDPNFVPSSVEKGPVPGSLKVLQGGAVTELEGFQEGQFIVQDISSQILAAEIYSAVRETLGRNDFTMLDLCAAPGGKSVSMAWHGAQVTATDLSEKRFKILENTVSRTRSGTPNTVKLVPWTEINHSPTTQDLIWVDAPCTGTGILRRHPDIRWLRQEKELGELQNTQLKLIKQGWDKVAPGGFLAYSVCSVLKEEGTEIIERAELTSYLVKQWFLTPQEGPHGDGFWAVLLRKI